MKRLVFRFLALFAAIIVLSKANNPLEYSLGCFWLLVFVFEVDPISRESKK